MKHPYLLGPLGILVLSTALSAEPSQVLLRLGLRDGSRVIGLVPAEARLEFKPETDALRRCAWNEVHGLSLAERPDALVEAQARAFVKDLVSETFQVRERAFEGLRRLGHGALSVLHESASSTDAEVAAKSRQLAGALTGGGVRDVFDRLTLVTGATLSGRAGEDHVELRTRFGVVQFPLNTIEVMEVLTGEVAAAQKKALAAAKTVHTPVVARPMPPTPVGALAQRFGPDTEDAGDGVQEEDGFKQLLAGMQVADFDRGPDGKQEVKAGSLVEDLYAPWGLLVRSVPNSKNAEHIVADETAEIFGISKGKNVVAVSTERREAGQHEKVDLSLEFIMPSSFDAKKRVGRPGGVRAIGCMIGPAPAGKIGLEAFDRAGRLLLRIFNRQEGAVDAGGMQANEFLGVRSYVPITRVRLFRAKDAGDEVTLRIDDVVFDRVGAADRDERFAAVETRYDERLVGTLVRAAGGRKDTLALRPLFVPDSEPAWDVPLDEIQRFEPPALVSAAANREAGPPTPRKRAGPVHAVLLQDGTQFRAHLAKLDRETAFFVLADGVELKLPRGALRKVDLYPERAAVGERPADLTLTKDEKNGVEFKQKLRGNNLAPPQQEPEKKEANHPAAGLPRMDNAAIVGLDTARGELVVDPMDGAGEWPIDLLSAHFLVFPPTAKAPGATTVGDWTLVLRQGSRFDANLKELGEGLITTEIAGGTATLPFAVVESLERKK